MNSYGPRPRPWPGGQFSFEHVSPGRVEVVLTDQYDKLGLSEVASQVRQVVVQDGETVAVNFDAATGVTLGGRVVDRDKPVLIEARAMEAEENAPLAQPLEPDAATARVQRQRPPRPLVSHCASEGQESLPSKTGPKPPPFFGLFSAEGVRSEGPRHSSTVMEVPAFEEQLSRSHETLTRWGPVGDMVSG